jgi:hypothetical protein
MDRNRYFCAGCVCIIIVSIVLGILAAVLFSLGLLPSVNTALPFIIALAIIVIVGIVSILVAFNFIRSRNGAVCCVLKYSYSLLIAAAIAIISSILALALGLTAASLISQILVFFIAASFFVLIVGLFDLIRCIVVVSLRLANREDDPDRNEWRGY